MKTFYSLQGLHLSVETSPADIQHTIAPHLSYFQQASLPEPPHISISLFKVDDGISLSSLIPQKAKKIFSGKAGPRDVPREGVSWRHTLFHLEGELFGYFPGVGVWHLEGPAGQGKGFLKNPEKRSPESVTFFFHLMVKELLRWHHRFTIHAAALEYQGKGLLISGYSGRGKTSSCLALVRHGYHFLSDDYSVARLASQAVEVLSWPVNVDVTDTTVGFFPELQNSVGTLQQGKKKKNFFIEDLYPGSLVDDCVPKFLFFPSVVQEPHSHVVRLSKRKALETLLPQSLLLTDKNLSRENLSVLSQLVKQVTCFELFLGQDLLSLPDLITPIVTE